MRRNEMLERLQLWKASITVSIRERAARLQSISAENFFGPPIWPSYPISKTYSSWQIGAALVLLIAISIAVYSSSGRRPWLWVGWFWFLGMLVPVIGLVQVGIQ